MIQTDIATEDQEDILDAERLLRVLQDLVDAVNELDERLQTIENSNP